MNCKMNEGEAQETPKPSRVTNIYGNINNYNVYEAPVTYNAPTTNTIEGEGKKPKVTDEQIARALVKINGKQKAVDSQRAWLGACCLLGWKYNFPRNLMDCCKRIDELPIKNEQLEFQCKYESIRMYGNWKFVKVDYKEWPNYTPRDDERQMFEKCLAVANALDEEIEKQGGCDS